MPGTFPLQEAVFQYMLLHESIPTVVQRHRISKNKICTACTSWIRNGASEPKPVSAADIHLNLCRVKTIDHALVWPREEHRKGSQKCSIHEHGLDADWCGRPYSHVNWHASLEGARELFYWQMWSVSIWCRRHNAALWYHIEDCPGRRKLPSWIPRREVSSQNNSHGFRLPFIVLEIRMEKFIQPGPVRLFI